jgi:hypothetical protein
MPQLRRTDVPISILIEHLERLLDLLLGIRVPHLARHHREELGEVDRPVPVGVDLVDHVLQLRLRRVLAQRTHDGAELLGSYGAVAIWMGTRGEGTEEGEEECELVKHPAAGWCGWRTHPCRTARTPP